MGTKRPSPVPNPTPQYLSYSAHNPVADLSRPRPHGSFVDDIRQLTHKRVGTEREIPRDDHNDICRQVRIWMISTDHRIAQMENNPAWEAKGAKGAREHVFRRSPRTFLKTVQEILCRPEDRIAFNHDDGLENLQHIIIDPRLITDTFLENIGLPKLIPARDGSKQEEKLEQRAKAIPVIKQLLLSVMEPVKRPENEAIGREEEQDSQANALEKEKYFRLMRIKSGPHEGDVIGTQLNHGKKILYRANLADAELRILHAEETYNAEIKTLQAIEMMLNEVLYALHNKWQALKGDEAALDVLREGMLRAVKLLANVDNDIKVDLREQIKQCTSLKDSTGRYNPWAMDKSIKKAKRLLSDRHVEIERIWGYLAQDKAKVTKLRSSQSIPVDNFLEKVEGMHEKFRLLRNRTDLTPIEKSILQNSLLEIKGELSKIKSPESAEFVTATISKIDAVLYAINTNDNEGLFEAYKQLNLVRWTEVPGDVRKQYSRIRATSPNALYLKVTGREKELVIVNLEETKRDMERVIYKPFTSFSTAITTKLDATIAAVESEESTQAASNFTEVYILGKIVRAHREILEVYHKLTINPEASDPQVLLRNLQEVHDQLAGHYVAPNLKTPEFNEAFGKIYHFLNSLKKSLRDLIYQDVNTVPEDTHLNPPEDNEPDSLEAILQFIEDKAPKWGRRVAGKIRGGINRLTDNRITRLMNRVRGRTSTTMRESIVKDAPPILRQLRPYNRTQHLDTYKKMKERVSEFNFEELFQESSA